MYELNHYLSLQEKATICMSCEQLAQSTGQSYNMYELNNQFIYRTKLQYVRAEQLVYLQDQATICTS